MAEKLQKINTQPDYQKIYLDIIRLKYPEKEKYCQSILSMEQLSVLDIIKLNDIIFSWKSKEDSAFNRRHRSYDRTAILQILDYQKKKNLNNSQLSVHFKLSRNTIAKWRKMFS